MKEAKPIRLNYYQTSLVSEGPFKAITVSILSCSDPENKGAPKYEDDRKHPYSIQNVRVEIGM